MDESNDPNDFATGEKDVSFGFPVVGEPGYEPYNLPPGSTIYPRFQVDTMCSGSAFPSITSYVTSTFETFRPQRITIPGNGITLTPPHGDLWEIVYVVAEAKTVIYNDNGPSYHCLFCNGYQTDRERGRDEPFQHTQDCIVLKARRMVEAQSKPVTFATQVDIAEQVRMQAGSREGIEIDEP